MARPKKYHAVPVSLILAIGQLDENARDTNEAEKAEKLAELRKGPKPEPMLIDKMARDMTPAEREQWLKEHSRPRGYSAASLVIMDEASRVDDALLAAVRPMQATVADGRFIALTTPAGKRGWFYKAWMEGEGWHRIIVRADECPRISKEFLAEEMQSSARCVTRPSTNASSWTMPPRRSPPR